MIGESYSAKGELIVAYDVKSRQEVLRLEGASNGLDMDSGGDFLVAGGLMNAYPKPSEASGIAMIWDFRPVERDTHEDRLALTLVRNLAASGESHESVFHSIETDLTIDETTREIAIDLWKDYQKKIARFNPLPPGPSLSGYR